MSSDDTTSAGEAPITMTKTRRVVVLLAALFTAFHVFATFLWIAPTSPARDVVPGKTLHNYMIPMFGQSWSVFAPNPINGDYRLQVRAVVETDGDKTTKKWVDATAAEASKHMHNLFPPRGAMTANDVASRFKGAWDDLSDGQKQIAELGYYKDDDWLDRMEQALHANGKDGDSDEGGDKGSKDKKVSEYVDMERIATAYATQVAYAMWGDDVQQVQFVVSRQNVIPFAQRNNPKAKRPDVQPVPTGWRGLIEEPGQSREKFADVFLDGVEGSAE